MAKQVFEKYKDALIKEMTMRTKTTSKTRKNKRHRRTKEEIEKAQLNVQQARAEELNRTFAKGHEAGVAQGIAQTERNARKEIDEVIASKRTRIVNILIEIANTLSTELANPL